MATPTSTYRLQIRPGFTLNDAAHLVPYLAKLGVGVVHLSPILQATTGSDHGYDVVDPTRIDPQRGGEAGWRALRDAVENFEMGILLDIVPNHLGVGVPEQNPSWWSVLRDGPDSPYRDWYDIDHTRGPVRLPVLADDVTPADVVVIGDILQYHELRLPLTPGSHQPDDDPVAVLARQHYRLIPWRDGDRELNYRRFFSVTSLAGVRVEDPAVFEATHAKIAELLRDDVLVGLRVDHPDGLADPGAYFERLRALAGPDRWLLGEKILEPGEQLPPWPIDGTTGYDALREVGSVLIDPADEPDFTRLYRDLTGDDLGIAEHVVTGKRRAATVLLAAEAERVAALVDDNPDDSITAAVAELATHLPVYRSYLPDGADHLTEAGLAARAVRPDLPIGTVLTAVSRPGTEAAIRFEQFTGAVMAKGTEDTAYYRYNRFVALNEVGGDPSRFGHPVGEFHRMQADRAQHLPQAMTTMATHDTKRGEDVRARLAVLSEIDRPWEDFAAFFLGRSRIPDRSLGYLVAQTLVAAGDIVPQRMHDYLRKAMREAAVGTSWTDPDPHFEATVHALVDEAYEDPDLQDALARLWVLIEQPGWSNTLAQKVLQLTMPGVPDVYQGTELWDNALVDPDNRRPVNFDDRAARLTMLDETVAAGGRPPVVDASGNAKLWITAQTLRLRRDHPEAFTGYRAMTVTGPAADHLVAFDRGGVVTLATRLPYRLATEGGWGDTVVHLPGAGRDVFSGREWSGEVPVRDLLSSYPVSVVHHG